MYDFAAIIKAFEIDGEFLSAEPYGQGHINQTFLVRTREGNGEIRYILQRVNDRLFPRVDLLMNNIRRVTEFNRSVIRARGGNPDRESLSLVYARDGAPFVRDREGNPFRVYRFIEGATAYQVVEKPQHFYESARAFGSFANLLAGFDATGLYEVLPDFHNTRVRLENFRDSVRADRAGRASSVAAEIAFVEDRSGICGRIVDRLKSGEIPTRVTHNDTKLNNVMIDDVTGRAVAVIDLDTVMPGSLCYDFGDSIRFGCNPAAEDEPDLGKVNFDLGLFRVYAEGYLSAVGTGITDVERENLAWGAILMTYECGMRFLADYLDGDVYFRTSRPGQNLDRARTQFKLVTDMERRLDRMNEIVADISRG
jgi:mdsC protein